MVAIDKNFQTNCQRQDRVYLTNIYKRITKALGKGRGVMVKPEEVNPLYFLLEAGDEFTLEQKDI